MLMAGSVGNYGTNVAVAVILIRGKRMLKLR